MNKTYKFLKENLKKKIFFLRNATFFNSFELHIAAFSAVFSGIAMQHWAEMG